jgi:hypothetical protein
MVVPVFYSLEIKKFKNSTTEKVSFFSVIVVYGIFELFYKTTKLT